MIGDENEALMNDDEKEAYSLIKKYSDGGIVYFERNRIHYIEEMRQGSIKGFVYSESKRFDRFDEKMAEVTLYSYRGCSQADRNTFPEYISSILRNCLNERELNIEETEKGISALLMGLEEIGQEYNDQGMQIAFWSVQRFIEKARAIKNDFEESVITKQRNY